MQERIIKKKEAIKRLNLPSVYAYRKLIESGVLAAPFKPYPGAHPVHNESQILEAERKIYELSSPEPVRSVPSHKRVCRPLSVKLRSALAQNRNGAGSSNSPRREFNP